MRVVGLWESTEACDAFFANRLRPVIREVDYPEPSSGPKFSHVHYHFERRQPVGA